SWHKPGSYPSPSLVHSAARCTMFERAILPSVALVLLTWITWRLFRHLILGSPLNNLKGPPAQSFATGMTCVVSNRIRHVVLTWLVRKSPSTLRYSDKLSLPS